jgi:NitT/TauT family transport system permease protein
MKKYIFGSLSIISILVLWQILTITIGNTYIFPSPLKVFSTFFILLKTLSTYEIIFLTLSRLIIALIIAILLGIALGLLSSNFSFLKDFLHPIVQMLRSLPVASIIVIILILVGNKTSLYIITFLMIFPIVYQATLSGVENISTDLKDSITLEPKHKMHIMFQIQLPLAWPYIKTAFFQSLGLGFKVIVMAEFISQTTKGIGNELYQGSISINYELVFAWTIIIIILVMLMEYFIKLIRKAI